MNRAADFVAERAAAPPVSRGGLPGLAPPVAELRDVHVRLGGRLVLRGVDLECAPGQITALIGLSGGGKTTCMRTICGLLAPVAGQVLLAGRPLARMTVGERALVRRRMSVMFQGGALFGSLNVYDNVAYAMRQLREHDEAEIAERVRVVLADVELHTAAELMPDQLSAGMRRRAALARALVRDADLYVLDDIDSGLDLRLLDRICDRLRERRDRSGGTYLLSTHDMDAARRIADTVAVLWDGRIVAAGPPAELERSGPEGVRQLLSGSADGPATLRSDTGDGLDRPDLLMRRQYGYEWETFVLPMLMVVAAIALTIVFFTHAY